MREWPGEGGTARHPSILPEMIPEHMYVKNENLENSHKLIRLRDSLENASLLNLTTLTLSNSLLNKIK